MPEHARECGLPALIRARHHQYPLRARQFEIVAHQRLFRSTPTSERQVEGLYGANVIGRNHHLRQAHRPAVAGDAPGEVEVQQIEVNLPVERRHR